MKKKFEQTKKKTTKKRGKNKEKKHEVVKDIEYYSKLLEENNISCIFAIKNVGAGSIIMSKEDLLSIIDIAKTQIEFLELRNKLDARDMIEKIRNNTGTNVVDKSKIVNYFG